MLYRLKYLPNGQLLGAERMNLDDLASETLADFEKLFERGPYCEDELTTEHGSVMVKWTGSPRGHGMGTFSLDHTAFCLAAVAGGRAQDEDEELLRSLCDSYQNSPLAQQLPAVQGVPFEELFASTDRPLLLTIDIPSLPPETEAAIQGVDILTAAAFMKRVGLWKPL